MEFRHTGQEGFTDFYDPRYSLAFSGVGDVLDLGFSYVRSCAFHAGFSPAIGVAAASNLTVENNVVHRTVGAGPRLKTHTRAEET